MFPRPGCEFNNLFLQYVEEPALHEELFNAETTILFKGTCLVGMVPEMSYGFTAKLSILIVRAVQVHVQVVVNMLCLNLRSAKIEVSSLRTGELCGLSVCFGISTKACYVRPLGAAFYRGVR